MQMNINDFIQIIGCDPKEMLHLLDKTDIMHINNILINSIKLRNINSRGIY